MRRPSARGGPRLARAHPPPARPPPPPPLPPPPPAAWTYWELRKEWRRGSGANGKQEFSDLPVPLFTFHTVEDFWLGFQRVPSIAEVFEDGRHGSRNDVEREEPDGTKITAGAQGYMLFREGVEPDWKQEVDGRRVTLNVYRSRLAVSNVDLSLIGRAWETLLLHALGELIDPAECINGVYLTDTHSGKSTSLRLEIWFASRDDRVADAICEEIQHAINRSTDGVFFPKFSKTEYFIKKHKVSAARGCTARARARARAQCFKRRRAHPPPPSLPARAVREAKRLQGLPFWRAHGLGAAARPRGHRLPGGVGRRLWRRRRRRARRRRRRRPRRL